MKTKWTEEQDQFVKNNFELMSDEEIADSLGKTESSIKNRRQKLKCVNNKNFWTKKEDNILINSFNNKTYEELSEILGRPYHGVIGRCEKLGLKRYIPYKPNDRIGNIKIVSDEYRDSNNKICVDAQCMLCQKIKQYKRNSLINKKKIISCGCKRSKRRNYIYRPPSKYPYFTTHHKLYSVWQDLKRKNSGVCKEWEDYLVFYKLYRKDYKEEFLFCVNDLTKPASKENISLLTYQESALKRIDSMLEDGKIITYEGLTVSQWADKLGLDDTTLRQRVQKFGWEVSVTIKKKQSNLEYFIEEILIDNNIDFKKQFRVDNFVADFFLPQYNLVIEADGLYWHSDKTGTSKEYHKNKKDTYNKNNYSSLFFRENEILFKKDIVKSIILNKVGKSNKIFARKCEIKQINNKLASSFCEENHLMGCGKGLSFGLYFNNDLVSVMRIVNLKDGIDISRFCCKKGYSVIGGFSKILSHIKKQLCPKFIQTFIDLRYGEGKYLNSLGFFKETEYLSFIWHKKLECYHRMKFPGETGYENGYNKVWDCGQAKYVHYIN